MITHSREHVATRLERHALTPLTFVLPRLIAVGILAIAPAHLYAQGLGTITGRVVQEGTSRPLPSVQISITGTRLGTVTTEDGRFRLLNVAAGNVQIRAVLLGMKPVVQTVSVPTGGTVAANISMTQIALDLDAVVVTGTAGAARQREVGNSISVINAPAAAVVPLSMEAGLQAQAPGVSVLQGSAQLGSAAQIRLRGVVSATQSNQPLIYIDGVRVRGEAYPNPSVVGRRSNNDNESPLNDINPADVERIEIIKGSAATTLYGTEAAAGVIQIFTKKGIDGRPVWTLDTQQGFSQEQPFAPAPAKFQYLDPWLQKGPQHQYNLSVQGGAGDIKYFLSGENANRQGILPNETLDQKGIRANFSFAPIQSLFLAWNSSYNYTNTHNVAGGVNPSGFIYNVQRGLTNFIASTNPDSITRILDQTFQTGVDRFISGLTATYTPVAAWSTRMTIGYDRGTSVTTRLRPFGFILFPQGDLDVTNFATDQETIDLSSTLSINPRPSFTNSFSAGGQFVSRNEHSLEGYTSNFPGPSNPTLSSGSLPSVSETMLRVLTGGFFVQDVIGWRDRLFITGGLRIDGSSAFGSGFGLQSYPKVSASYVMSEEPYWKKSLGDLKLRAAYGSAGRAPGAFDAVRTWNPAGFGNLPAYIPQNVGNSNLGPERTSETELGFDWSVFDGKVATGFTHYARKTSAALFPVPQIPSLGFQSSQLLNVGEITNNGVEATVNWNVLQTRRLGWLLGASLATNHSLVTDLGGSASVSMGNAGWLIQGQPVMVIQGVHLLNPTAIADPQVVKNYNFGPNAPTRIIGLNTSISLPGDITLSARGEYQAGGYESDGSSDDAASRNVTSWPTCVAYQALVKAGTQAQANAYDRLHCNSVFYQPFTFIQKVDFAKLREVTARAKLPVHTRNISSAYLSLSANNWYRWLNSDWRIFDPETMGSASPGTQIVRATGVGAIPPPETFTLSLRLVF
jgi:TonB-dependent starch-binding outer membrane protein SusC